ncbi:MAG: hypothetical protein K1000chlam4_00261 [Chlamydiae bacterium]|nr:hypothetical protein [Chlamydiota bacterium]
MLRPILLVLTCHYSHAAKGKIPFNFSHGFCLIWYQGPELSPL